jgi:hypothetical protein
MVVWTERPGKVCPLRIEHDVGASRCGGNGGGGLEVGPANRVLAEVRLLFLDIGVGSSQIDSASPLV